MTSRAKRNRIQQSRKSIWGRGKSWFITGGVAAAIALLVVLTMALAGPETTGSLAPVSFPSSPGSGGAVSSSLPNFPLALYQGQEILGSRQPNLHDLLGKQPLVLNFWASNCPPCLAEIPEIEQVWRKYKDKVMFLGLDIGQFAGLGGPEDSKRELRQLGVTYPAAPAPDITAVQGLGVQGLPSTYFITRDGTISRKWVGTLNKAKLTELVENLLGASSGGR